jgi:hypothetical protein
MLQDANMSQKWSVSDRLFEMGFCQSLCARGVQKDINAQYQMLVLTKPTPISLESIRLSGSEGSDSPLFPEISSSDEDGMIPVGSKLTTEEIRLYPDRNSE